MTIETCVLCKHYAPTVKWAVLSQTHLVTPCFMQYYWRHGRPEHAGTCNFFESDSGAAALLWHARHTLPEGQRDDR